MLNNLSNFFNLIKSKMIKSAPEDSDLLILGTRDSKYGGGYKPVGVKYSDFADTITSNIPALNQKLPKDYGTTYNTFAIKTVTALEYAALTPDPATIYFIV